MEQRKCEIFEDGVWRKISFQLLLKGDKFRLTDPPGIGFEDGTREFIADCDAYINDGVYTVITK